MGTKVRGARLVAVIALALMAVGMPAQGAEPDTSGGPRDGAPLCGETSTGASGIVSGPLRVASFNVLHAETDEGDATLEARLPIAAESIDLDNLDVVGLQEVTSNTGHGNVAQRLAELLAARTQERWEWCWSQSNPHVPLTPDIQPGGGNPVDDLASQFGNMPDPGDFREGLAIVTRLDITRARFRHLLPRSYEAAACIDPDPFCRLAAAFDSRQVLWANIETGPSQSFDMFTTHVAHGLTPASDTTKLLQIQQAQGIVDEWATPDAWPDFLVGDFNSDPSTDRYQTMVDGGYVDAFKAAGGVECTAPGVGGCTGGPIPEGDAGTESYTSGPTRGMASRIDYVWSRADAPCSFSAAALLGNDPATQPDGRYLWASDHLGVAATISC